MEDWYQACRRRVAGQDGLLLKLVLDAHNIITKNEQSKLVIMTGPLGSGKTFISLVFAEESSRPYEIFYCHALYSQELGESTRFIKNIFDNNDIIILENIECILLSTLSENDSDPFYDNQQEIIEELQENYLNKLKGKYIIATTSSPQLLNIPWINNLTCQKENVIISIGNDKQKEEILSFLLAEKNTSITAISSPLFENDQHRKEMIRDLSRKCHGYTARDLITLTRKIQSHHFKFNQSVNKNIIDKLLLESRPFILEDMSISRSVMDKPINDLVGNDDQIKLLLEKLRKPYEFPELNLGYPRGIVIWGPSGCGKSHLVSALCQESGLNHIIVEAINIRSKYMGASERNLSEVFKRARDCSPCILVFEHFETLIPNRSSKGDNSDNPQEGSSSSSGTDERLLAVFLCEVDGMETDLSRPVIVIATANRIDNLDPSVVRKGRLELHVEMKELDADQRRKFIFMKMEKMPINLDQEERDWLVKVTDQWSGSNLEGLFNGAALLAVTRDKSTISKEEFQITLEESFLFNKKKNRKGKE